MRLRRLPAVVCALGCVLGARGAMRWQEPDLDALPLLRLVEEARVRNADDPGAGFARFGGVDVDRDGQLYVGDNGDGRIHVYSPTGQLLRKLGEPRPGTMGPGSFGVKGDTVWLIESGRSRRITLYNRAGVWLSSTTTAFYPVALHNRVTGSVVPRFMRPDGNFVGELGLYSMSENAPENGVRPDAIVNVPYILFDANGNVLETLGWTPVPPPEPLRPEYVMIGEIRHQLPLAPSDRPSTLLLADGELRIERQRARADTISRIRVTRTSFAGDTVFSRSFTYQPMRYSPAQLDSVAKRSALNPSVAGRIVNGEPEPAIPLPDPLNAARLIRARLNFPEFQMPVGTALQGRDGALWLLREGIPRIMNRLVLLDPQGRPRGRFESPTVFRIVWSSGDTVWAIQPNQHNVSWLVRYRISQ